MLCFLNTPWQVESDIYSLILKSLENETFEYCGMNYYSPEWLHSMSFEM